MTPYARCCLNGSSAFGQKRVRASRKMSPRSGPRWLYMAASASPVPSAARRCNASAMPTTRPTTARNVRPEGEYSPTGPYRGYSRMIGREPLMSWAEPASLGSNIAPGELAVRVLEIRLVALNEGRLRCELFGALEIGRGSFAVVRHPV